MKCNSAYWWSCTLPILLCTVLASPPSTPPIPSNTTAIPVVPPQLPPIDYRFFVERTAPTARINGLSSYMNSILTLITLSFQPFEAMMQPKDFSYRPFQNVRISVSGLPVKSEIQRRFAIWGIYEALTDIAGEARPMGGRWELEWNGDEVGVVDFEAIAGGVANETSGPGAEGANAVQVTSNGTAEQLYETSATDTLESDLTFGLFDYPLPLTLKIDFLTNSIRINDFFMAVANALTGCAQFSEYDHAMEFLARPLGFDAVVYVRWFDRERLQAQPLLYGYVISGLAEITKEVYSRSAYRELDALLDVTAGGQTSSIGIIRIRRRPPSVAGEVD